MPLAAGALWPRVRAMSPEITAWLILLFGYLLPLAHVAVSPAAGPWRAPAGARCPIGPRPGWLVMVLLLGPIGWLLFVSSRARLRRQGRRRPELRG